MDSIINPRNSIFTITVGEKDTEGLGCSRCVGFAHTLGEAREWVLMNLGDMQEHCYEYAVIEEVQPGVYMSQRKEWWFEWKNGRFISCKKPKFAKESCCYGIG